MPPKPWSGIARLRGSPRANSKSPGFKRRSRSYPTGLAGNGHNILTICANNDNICANSEKDVQMNSKRENFVRLAESRVSKAIKSIQVIGNLANRSNYEYSEADAKAIINALQKELSDLQTKFRLVSKSDKQKFRLKK